MGATVASLMLTGPAAVTGTINATVRLDLSLLSPAQVNQLRSDTLAAGSFRDYNVVTATGGLNGGTPNFLITNMGSFSPGEWSELPLSGNAVTLRFTPVPEPAGVLAACCVTAIAAVRPLTRKRT